MCATTERTWKQRSVRLRRDPGHESTSRKMIGWRNVKRPRWETALYEMTIYICTVATAAWIVWSFR
jgi:hypothetical protein